MKLFITRHGTTQWNMERRLQGWRDSDLTIEGIERAIKLGRSLEFINFDKIYSSPQNRALETAKLIRGAKDVEIEEHIDLRELGFGIWEGMDLSEIENKYPDEYFTYRNKPELYKPINGGESFQDLFNRVKIFLDDIKYVEADNVLIVTHGVTIKAIIAIIKDLSLDEFSSLPVFTGTSLNICEVKDGKIELIKENDTSHMDSDNFEESTM